MCSRASNAQTARELPRPYSVQNRSTSWLRYSWQASGSPVGCIVLSIRSPYSPSYSDEVRAYLAAPSRAPAVDAVWTRAEAAPPALVPLVVPAAGADSVAAAGGWAELAPEPSRSVPPVAGSVEARSDDCLPRAADHFSAAAMGSAQPSCCLSRVAEKRSAAERRPAEVYSAGVRWHWATGSRPRDRSRPWSTWLRCAVGLSASGRLFAEALELRSAEAYSAGAHWHRATVLPAWRPEPTTGYLASLCCWVDAPPADCSLRALELRSAELYSAGARWRSATVLPAWPPEPTMEYLASRRRCWVEAHPAGYSPRAAERRSAAATTFGVAGPAGGAAA